MKMIISLLLMILNTYSSYSVPIDKTSLYVSASDISIRKAIKYPLKIRNNFGNLNIDEVYFLKNAADYDCPEGTMKLVYKDQLDNYRVASSYLDEEYSTTGIARAPLFENCKKMQKSLVKNYMKQTISSQAKINNQAVHYKFTTTTESTVIPLDSDSHDLISNDISSIELEEKNFPAYMFDDKGDAIYGSGLLLSILTALIWFLKMLRDNKKLLKQLEDAKTCVNEYLKKNNVEYQIKNKKTRLTKSDQAFSASSSPRTFTTSSNTMYITAPSAPPQPFLLHESSRTDSSNADFSYPLRLSNTQESKSQHIQEPASYHAQESTNQHIQEPAVPHVQESTSQHIQEPAVHHVHDKPPIILNINMSMPPSLESNQLTSASNKIDDQNINYGVENQKNEVFCKCKKGNCSSGRCTCFINNKKCGRLCHGKVINENCLAK